jgi:hypothetical protein
MILMMPELRLKPLSVISPSSVAPQWSHDLEADEMDRVFNDSFRAALVLTGSIDAAETAVAHAIDALEPGVRSVSGDGTLRRSARSSTG